MKVRRLVVASLLVSSLAVAAPAFADSDQPNPGPAGIVQAVKDLLSAAAYGIEISGSLL